MAILPIKIYGDPVLRKKCEPITEITPELRQLARDMLETMYDAPGCGLAYTDPTWEKYGKLIIKICREG